MGPAPSSSSYILATAGHVDHGKSALVRALTGIDPDRLPEEKARGITIELGFAHLALPSPSDPTTQFNLGVVDVPGHEDFVKNMVAGVGSIDVALLVVAADDGWMPQTEEHLEILEYLRVTRAVVALSKADLAPNRQQVLGSVRASLAGSPFATASIVPTALPAGEGLTELRQALAELLAVTPPPSDQGQPRLPIDRVFSLPGAGTIVTGTLTGGSLATGQAVVVQPSGRSARIRAIQSHGRNLALARPGTRTALNLPDIPLAHDPQNLEGVARGRVITLAELGGPARLLDVELHRSGRAMTFMKRPPRALKDGARVRLHHGSTNVAARLSLARPLEPGSRALAQLRLEAPIFVLTGDRFILRDWAEQSTLAGGCILDLDRTPAQFRTATQQAFLLRRASPGAGVEAWILSEIERDRLLARSQLVARSRFGRAALEEAVLQLINTGQLSAPADLLALPIWWTTARAQALEIVRRHHQAHPERIGIPLTELRAGLDDAFADGNFFDALVADLAQDGVRREHTLVRNRSHRPSLPPSLLAAADQIRAALAARPLEPPARGELAPDAVAQQALRFLVDTGEAVAAGPDLILLASAVARARQLIRQHLRKHGPATASELRVALGTNRRVVIPLLEHFDRDGLTLRTDDRRSLKPPEQAKP